MLEYPEISNSQAAGAAEIFVSGSYRTLIIHEI
jgi:hypothetical protein